MEQSQVAFAKDTHRCPFCHEDVDVADDEWVACKQCLARHHVGCWSEGNRCSACQGGTPLVAPTTGRFRPMPTTDGVPALPPDGVSADAIRFVTSQALDEEHRRHLALAAALLTPLTLGVYPILTCEGAFAAHSTNNKTDERPLPCVSREIVARLRVAREHAYDWSRGLGVLRAALPSLTLVVSMISLGVALSYWFEGRYADDLKAAYLCQLVGLGATFAYLHVFRETVRRHEFHQFFVKLVSEAVPPNRAKEVLRVTRKAWNGRRALDALLTLLGVVPFLGLALLPIAGARMRGALLLHEEHEDAFPRARR